MSKVDLRNYIDQNGSLKKELKEDKDIIIEKSKKYEKMQFKSKLK